jgi:hypothetical protein
VAPAKASVFEVLDINMPIRERCSVPSLTPMMRRPRADLEENRGPGQGISFRSA